MNHLEINNIEDLSFAEMSDVTGGNFWKYAFEFAAIYDAVMDFGFGFKQGFADATR